MLGIGSLIAGWATYGCYTNFINSAQWRVPLGVQNAPAIILAALIMLFPESPRWLIDHNRGQEGLKNLAKLHANGDVNDSWVRAEFDQIQVRLSPHPSLLSPCGVRRLETNTDVRPTTGSTQLRA